MTERFIEWMEKGFVPDWLIRIGIRRLLAERVRIESKADPEIHREDFMAWVNKLKQNPVAIHPDAANEQHYELPPEFFQLALGSHRKYSCCYYPAGSESLDEAEAIMLQKTCERAGLEDGMEILELGCGWGSLTLWMAEKYPNSKITAVSNSAPQRQFIEKQCQEKGFQHVKIVTADMNEFQIDSEFDRVVSIEMFEHMRNYEILLNRVASWLKPDGKLFVHIFCHREVSYPFETEGAKNWMGKYFFTGGIMPSEDLLLFFQNDLVIETHWRVSGIHYGKTSRDWLNNMDARKSEILPILSKTYGQENVTVWWNRWRIFFMACEELFHYDQGKEWFVSHYLFKKKSH